MGNKMLDTLFQVFIGLALLGGGLCLLLISAFCFMFVIHIFRIGSSREIR
jgi:hypothetical protein